MSDYAIIGWGSLIWDLDNLAPHVAGDWRLGEGPALPLEFCRVSPKRKHGLVVCIDETHGQPCPTHVIASVRADVGSALDDLARRERAPHAMIGAVCRESGRAEGPGAHVVAEWCAAAGWRGAVWTGLAGNFHETTGAQFTLERGETYLLGLAGESRDEAVRYIENAPAATDTPLRRRLSATAWWREEAARVRGAGGPD